MGERGLHGVTPDSSMSSSTLPSGFTFCTTSAPSSGTLRRTCCAGPSTWQRAYKHFNEDQERFLADARHGAAVTVTGK